MNAYELRQMAERAADTPWQATYAPNPLERESGAYEHKIQWLMRFGAEIQRLTREQIWQPIETAPKDEPILGFATGVMTVVEWYPRSKRDGWWSLVEAGSYADDAEWTPTHWMPLPAPPNHDGEPR